MKIFWVALFLVLSPIVAFAQEDARVCFKKFCYQVEVVQTLQALSKGLSGRESLSEDEGMLFVFTESGQHRFWMKDMLFDLDILWLDKNGKVVHIEENLPPCTPNACPSFTSAKPAQYVLEIPAGASKDRKIRIGSIAKINL